MKPQMEAIELKQNSSLLAGSTPGYGGAGGGEGDAPESDNMPSLQCSLFVK